MSKIFMVLVNADSTEGRGPMRNEQAFVHRKYAEDYIVLKSGKSAKTMIDAGWYDIRPIEVHEGVYDPDVIERQAALAKLTQRECELLGIPHS